MGRTHRTHRWHTGGGAVLATAALILTCAGTAPATSAPDTPARDATGPPGKECLGEPPGHSVVRPRATERNFHPLTDSKWAFDGRQVMLTERGTPPAGPRRPFEYAVVTKGRPFGSLTYRAKVRIDEPVSRNDRDVVLIWNYQSPTRFYYVHLSQDNAIYPHNGIFVVDDADRRRIDDQWDGSVGAAPAITDLKWHDVRVSYCATTGAIAVHVDGAARPLMTATDTTFAGGRAAFGSFDNFGRARDLVLSGTPERGEGAD